jgi:ribosome maturation factor RimP
MTRQIRLSTLDQIEKRLKEFIGKKINIVLCNRKVLFGELKRLDGEKLSFLNMRQQVVTLPLADISEVYLDFIE